MSIKLPKQTELQLIDSIKRYVNQNMDQDIGDLKAYLLLEFCLKEIGPSIYNQAIAEAQIYMQERIEDLKGSCYERELNYWDQ